MSASVTSWLAATVRVPTRRCGAEPPPIRLWPRRRFDGTPPPVAVRVGHPGPVHARRKEEQIERPSVRGDGGDRCDGVRDVLDQLGPGELGARVERGALDVDVTGTEPRAPRRTRFPPWEVTGTG